MSTSSSASSSTSSINSTSSAVSTVASSGKHREYLQGEVSYMSGELKDKTNSFAVEQNHSQDLGSKLACIERDLRFKIEVLDCEAAIERGKTETNISLDTRIQGECADRVNEELRFMRKMYEEHLRLSEETLKMNYLEKISDLAALLAVQLNMVSVKSATDVTETKLDFEKYLKKIEELDCNNRDMNLQCTKRAVEIRDKEATFNAKVLAKEMEIEYLVKQNEEYNKAIKEMRSKLLHEAFEVNIYNRLIIPEVARITSEPLDNQKNSNTRTLKLLYNRDGKMNGSSSGGESSNLIKIARPEAETNTEQKVMRAEDQRVSSTAVGQDTVLTGSSDSNNQEKNTGCIKSAVEMQDKDVNKRCRKCFLGQSECRIHENIQEDEHQTNQQSVHQWDSQHFQEEAGSDEEASNPINAPKKVAFPSNKQFSKISSMYREKIFLYIDGEMNGSSPDMESSNASKIAKTSSPEKINEDDSKDHHMSMQWSKLGLEMKDMEAALCAKMSAKENEMAFLAKQNEEYKNMCEDLQNKLISKQLTNGMDSNVRFTFSGDRDGEMDGGSSDEESSKSANVSKPVVKTITAQNVTKGGDQNISTAASVLSNKAVQVKGFQKASIFLGAWLLDWLRIESRCGKR